VQTSLKMLARIYNQPLAMKALEALAFCEAWYPFCSLLGGLRVWGPVLSGALVYYRMDLRTKFHQNWQSHFHSMSVRRKLQLKFLNCGGHTSAKQYCWKATYLQQCGWMHWRNSRITRWPVVIVAMCRCHEVWHIWKQQLIIISLKSKTN